MQPLTPRTPQASGKWHLRGAPSAAREGTHHGRGKVETKMWKGE